MAAQTGFIRVAGSSERADSPVSTRWVCLPLHESATPLGAVAFNRALLTKVFANVGGNCDSDGNAFQDDGDHKILLV